MTADEIPASGPVDTAVLASQLAQTLDTAAATLLDTLAARHQLAPLHWMIEPAIRYQPSYPDPIPALRLVGQLPAGHSEPDAETILADWAAALHLTETADTPRGHREYHGSLTSATGGTVDLATVWGITDPDLREEPGR